MTKVTLHYDLARPLMDEDLENVARVHGGAAHRTGSEKSDNLHKPDLGIGSTP